MTNTVAGIADTHEVPAEMLPDELHDLREERPEIWDEEGEPK